MANGLKPGDSNWPKDAWPLHSVEKRSASAAIAPPEEGRARLAYARNEANVPLSPEDWDMLDKYPGGGPWQEDWELACADYLEKRYG